eukprot:CAMPEP_0205808140 /NCGR_PEP_ID=MMETSP0205-20121125/12015_1 /ASSEMBLY_ACC=CAM_ASM_000278 /TAXON_ID=36767 /ORGANISM="Euplotes focardii, Strain TN1" /LENGTH=44 /DNA_ID= /DNA_START= /DNA_END= /DNA_ORIENTATION=
MAITGNEEQNENEDEDEEEQPPAPYPEFNNEEDAQNPLNDSTAS